MSHGRSLAKPPGFEFRLSERVRDRIWPGGGQAGMTNFFSLRTPRNKQRASGRYAHSLFSGDQNNDAVISGALNIPRVLIGQRQRMWAHVHVRLSPGRCCRWHKRGKTATPNLRQFAHSPRMTARFDNPFYPPIWRLLDPRSDTVPPKTETRMACACLPWLTLFFIWFH